MKTLSVFAVALHPEGVDRNSGSAETFGAKMTVALHPEGVDRNSRKAADEAARKASPSTRRAWIEICKMEMLETLSHMVALHPEGVDRNVCVEKNTCKVFRVALHPEGVDRNCSQGTSSI